jgi:hypothetical protein
MPSETYEYLKRVAKGEEVDRWSYPDKLIDYISNTESKLPKIDIVFDDDDDFLDVLGIEDDRSSEDRYVWRRFMSRGYYNDYDFDMWRYEDDWKEGYIVDAFKGENIDLLNNILKLTNPTLQFTNVVGDRHKLDIARFLSDEFEDEVSDITYEYGRYHEECIKRGVREELENETKNPFITFGIIDKIHGYKFNASVITLLQLYKHLNAYEEDLKGLLTKLYEKYGKKNIGNWYELEYNAWCDDYDDEGFQQDVKRNLEKMLEKIEEDFEGVNQEEFNKMYEKVLSLGGFNEYIDLPDKGVQVLFHNFNLKTNKLYFDLYKGNKKEERSVDNLEDLNLELYHPELFESIRKILKKLL